MSTPAISSIDVKVAEKEKSLPMEAKSQEKVK